MEVSNKTVVSLRYRMRNSAGEELENTFDGPGIQYLHGSGKILPELEAALLGLKPGDKKYIKIQTPQFFELDVEVASVRTASEEELATGAPAVSKECGPDCCC